jgi:hypothetical protein
VDCLAALQTDVLLRLIGDGKRRAKDLSARAFSLFCCRIFVSIEVIEVLAPTAHSTVPDSALCALSMRFQREINAWIELAGTINSRNLPLSFWYAQNDG